MLVTYHGTNARFKKFDRSRSRIVNDNFGGGIYLTDNIAVAKQYAAAMTKKFGGEKIVYKVQSNMRKIFDVDMEYTGRELISILKGVNFEIFARSAGLLNFGSDKYKVMTELKEGTAILLGNQIFRGLSQGFINTAKARERLQRLGYDGIRYNGGNPSLGTRNYNVFLAYDTTNLKIQTTYLYVPKEENVRVLQ